MVVEFKDKSKVVPNNLETITINAHVQPNSFVHFDLVYFFAT
jgi:hypothetical protein